VYAVPLAGLIGPALKVFCPLWKVEATLIVNEAPLFVPREALFRCWDFWDLDVSCWDYSEGRGLLSYTRGCEAAVGEPCDNRLVTFIGLTRSLA